MNAKSLFKCIVCSSLAMLALIGASRVDASVVIAGTRVIYHQEDSEVTVKLSNVGKTPALIQVWLDEGDPKVDASAIDVPFTITPPLSRIDPGKGQTLRIVYTGEALPQDRESVFWMNVLEVPPKPTGDAADTNHLQLAFRSRIKLFFRPAGLIGHAEEAPAQMTWRLTTSQGAPALEVHNPTPFNVSLTDVELTDGNTVAKFDEGDMVGPGKTDTIVLKGTSSASPAAVVQYHALNDYGGAIEGKAPLLQAVKPASTAEAAPATAPEALPVPSTSPN